MTSPNAPQIRLWVAFLVALLSGPTLVRAASPQVAPRGRPGFRRRAPRQLAPPAHPERIRATYELGGQTISVTEGEFYDLYKVIKNRETGSRVPVTPRQVVEHILSFADARQLGFALSKEGRELLNPLKATDNPVTARALSQRLAAEGLKEDLFLRYLSQRHAIQRMRNLFANSTRVLSSDVYDTWKAQHHTFLLGYLEFDADAYAEKLRQHPPSEALLRSFYKTNNVVINELRQRPNISADILVFDAEKTSSGGHQEETPKPDYAAALSYFNANRERLMKNIPTQKRHLIYWKPHTPIQDIVTPFQVLRPIIEKEMRLRPFLDKAFQEARQEGSRWNPAATARKYGLEYKNLDHVDRNTAYLHYRELGPQLFNQVWNTGTGAICSQIQSHGNLYFFWRTREKRSSALPAFEEAMKLGLREKYDRYTSYEAAKKAAVKLMTAINLDVRKASARELSEIDAKYVKLEQQEIRDKQLERQQDIQMVRLRLKSRKRAEQLQVENRLRPAFFKRMLKEKGLQEKTLGPFEFTPGLRRREKIKDREKLKIRFLKNFWSLRTMEKGAVFGRVASDQLSRTHFIIQLLDRRAPAFKDMPPVDYVRIRANLSRARRFNKNFRWSYNQLVARFNWMDE